VFITTIILRHTTGYVRLPAPLHETYIFSEFQNFYVEIFSLSFRPPIPLGNTVTQRKRPSFPLITLYSSNAIDLHLEGSQFEPRLRHLLSSLKGFVSFVTPSRHIDG